MKNRNNQLFTMPRVALAAALLILFTGCGVTDSNDNPEALVVPFEIRVSTQSMGDGLYMVTGGVIAASWEREEDVESYTLVIVEADGSKSDPFTRAPHQLETMQDRISYVVVVGGPKVYLWVNEQRKDELIQHYQQEYAHHLNRWNKLEVRENR